MVSAGMRWTWLASLLSAVGRLAIGIRAVALSLGLVVLLVPRVAHAELNLQWTAPPGCPTKEDVLRRLPSLGVDPSRVSANLAVAGSITTEGDGFVLTVWVREGDGERRRSILNQSCSELAKAAAVTLALLLEIELAAPPGEGSPQNAEGERGAAAGSAPAVSSPPVAPQARTQKPPTRSEDLRRWGVVLQVPSLTAGLGPFSKASWGAGGGLGTRFGPWQLTLSVSAYAQETVTSSFDTIAFGAAVTRASGGLTACHLSSWGRAAVGPCASVRLERAVAVGVGEGVSPTEQRLHWPAVSGGPSARLRLAGPLSLGAAIEADWNILRPRLVVKGLGSAGRIALAGVTSTLRVEWIF